MVCVPEKWFDMDKVCCLNNFAPSVLSQNFNHAWTGWIGTCSLSTSMTFCFLQTLIWNGSNGSQLQKLPNQGKETLDVLPFAANGNDFLATIDEQKLTVYKWLSV